MLDVNRSSIRGVQIDPDGVSRASQFHSRKKPRPNGRDHILGTPKLAEDLSIASPSEHKARNKVLRALSAMTHSLLGGICGRTSSRVCKDPLKRISHHLLARRILSLIQLPRRAL